MTSDALRRVDALIGVGLRLARAAPSGRILLARIRDGLDPSWIPRPWGDVLAAELDAAHSATLEPLPLRAVERALRNAWGNAPTDELDDLDPDPVAVTPGSQVHRGVLDGSPVAVKVLRPGLARSVRQDLVLLEGLLAPLRAAFPRLDAQGMLQEFRERILDELDLETEAVVQRHFHRRLRRHSFLTVPAPIMSLAREQVLVSEWVDGIPLRETPDHDRAAAQLVVFVLGAGRAGYVHADPNPDDALVLDDGRLAILDFGAARAVSPPRIDLAAQALAAFMSPDAAGLGAALEQLEWLPSSHATDAQELVAEVLGELAGPGAVRLDGEAILAARDRLIERLEDVVALALIGRLLPEDLWPARAAAQLFSTIARIGATGPWSELSLAAMREGWEAQPGAQRA